jgi:hypothetical protein
VRRFAHFIFIVVLFFLFTLLSSQATYAIDYCGSGGRPEVGRGGAVGDTCNTAFDDCCKTPDGLNEGTLVCDGRKGPTQNTCILLTNFGKEGQACKNDDYCDKNDKLRCVNKECTKQTTCQKAGGACDEIGDCCANSNLTCKKLIGAARGTCEVNTACKKVDEGCTKNADCCQGQHLSCDVNGTKKCKSTCATKGQSCSSLDSGGVGSCCADQGLSCDLDRLVDPSKPVICQSKTDMDNVRDHGDTAPKPTLPPPPSPPCAKYTDGQCVEVVTAFGNISTAPAAFIKSLYGMLLAMSGAIAVLLLMRAGYKIQTSQGKPEAIKEGQEQVTATIVGLFFLIFAFVLLQVISSDLLKIPGITP